MNNLIEYKNQPNGRKAVKNPKSESYLKWISEMWEAAQKFDHNPKVVKNE